MNGTIHSARMTSFRDLSQLNIIDDRFRAFRADHKSGEPARGISFVSRISRRRLTCESAFSKNTERGGDSDSEHRSLVRLDASAETRIMSVKLSETKPPCDRLRHNWLRFF